MEICFGVTGSGQGGAGSRFGGTQSGKGIKQRRQSAISLLQGIA